jgi:hypothetical protein
MEVARSGGHGLIFINVLTPVVIRVRIVFAGAGLLGRSGSFAKFCKHWLKLTNPELFAPAFVPLDDGADQHSKPAHDLEGVWTATLLDWRQ